MQSDSCPKISLDHPALEESEIKLPSALEQGRSRFISSNIHSHLRRKFERQDSGFTSTPKHHPIGSRLHGSDGKSPIMRSGSKRFSMFEKQKIFALTKLMDNY